MPQPRLSPLSLGHDSPSPARGHADDVDAETSRAAASAISNLPTAGGDATAILCPVMETGSTATTLHRAAGDEATAVSDATNHAVSGNITSMPLVGGHAPTTAHPADGDRGVGEREKMHAFFLSPTPFGGAAELQHHQFVAASPLLSTTRSTLVGAVSATCCTGGSGRDAGADGTAMAMSEAAGGDALAPDNTQS